MAHDKRNLIDTDGNISLAQGFEEPAALAEILAALSPIELQSGDTLVHQGDASDAAYFLERGVALVYAESPYGSVPLSTLQGPYLIGEIGTLAGLARTASVKALTSTRVFRIDRTQLFELCQKSLGFLTSVVRQLGQQIDSVNKAVTLFTNALAALEKREFDKAILDDLVNPSPQLIEFQVTFRRFADQILSKRRLQDELAGAALIQQSFLPKESTVNLPGSDVEIRAKIRPAREVGGDFYDFFMLDDHRLAIFIGDVCGKGMSASLFMAVVVTVLRVVAREEPDAASTISRANALLCRDNASSMFATTFYAELNLRSGTLNYCNCGHNAPVHIFASGERRWLASTGLPLALYEDRPAAATCIELNPGDDIILFTDGVTETLNLSGEEFGEGLLAETLKSNRNLPTAELISRLFAAVDSFAQGADQADDMTCVAIRRQRCSATVRLEA